MRHADRKRLVSPAKIEIRFPEADITEAEEIEFSNGDIYYELTLVKEDGESFEVH